MEECIDGSRPLPVDAIVYELSQRIRTIVEEEYAEAQNFKLKNIQESKNVGMDSVDPSTGSTDLNGERISYDRNIKLEVEGRLGCIIDPVTGQRIRIPVNNEVLISSEYKHYFQSGISRLQFIKLQNKLHQFLQNQYCVPPKSSRNQDFASHRSILHWTGLDNLERLEEFRLVKDFETPVRLSYALPRKLQDSPVELQRKIKLLTWTVFTGMEHDNEDTVGVTEFNSATGRKEIVSEFSRVDYRINVNIEIGMNIGEARSAGVFSTDSDNLVLRRVKKRLSFCNKVFNIDTTEVSTDDCNSTKQLAQSTTTYEVEVELNPKITIDFAIYRSPNGQMGYNILKLCDVFVGILRDLCHIISNQQSSLILNYPANTNQQTILKEHSDQTIWNKRSNIGNNDYSSRKSRKRVCLETMFRQKSIEEIQYEEENLINLLEIAQPAEVIKSLAASVSQKPPLIGDYIYRVVLPRFENTKSLRNLTSVHGEYAEIFDENGIVDRSITKKNCTELGEERISNNLIPLNSLYTHSNIELTGPWGIE